MFLFVESQGVYRNLEELYQTRKKHIEDGLLKNMFRNNESFENHITLSVNEQQTKFQNVFIH